MNIRFWNTKGTSTSKSKDISKKENMASVLNRVQQENINLFHSNQVRRKNHANFNKLRRTIEDSIGLQSDPAGHVKKLSNKSFTKDVHKLLNKLKKLLKTHKNFKKL